MALVLSSCHDETSLPKETLSLEMYSGLKTPEYQINNQRIQEKIHRLARVDNDRTAADLRTHKYYLNGGKYLWINRMGVSHSADTLLSFLYGVDTMGFTARSFCVEQIEKDIRRVRTLDLGEMSYSEVLARLEFNLTKAYFRYSVGQRFGFMNPTYTLNRFDVRDSDSVRVTYNHVFDIAMEHPTDSFFHVAMRKIGSDSVGFFLRAIHPASPLYARLSAELQRKDLSDSYRRKLLCNLERSRWRTLDSPERHGRYVLVNIPAYQLYAVNKDSTLVARVGCGTMKTKTPLLHSQLMRIDVNPVWIIPYSIIKKDIARHAGNADYFHRHHYYVCERPSFRRVDLADVTSEMLMSGRYSVVQEGGQGNSLGRIIFRFLNNFSVFLHDTSTPGFFSRDDRGVSHGCVRVQNPYLLAEFLLGDKTEMAEKVKYSMTADVGSHDELPPEKRPKLNKKMLVRSVKIEPQVPLFLTYYTIYPDKDNHLVSYPDVYGYDGVMWEYLQTYMK